MGILSNYQDSVTLINRTIGAGQFEVPLNVRYDGEDTVLMPGENPGFPRAAAGHAMRQNPLMGSRHSLNPSKFISLVGIKGETDCTPISEETLTKAAAKLEAIDRDGEWWGEPERQNVRLSRKTPFSAYEAQAALPQDYHRAPDID